MRDVERCRWCTHLCAPSLFIDVQMGQIAHDHLVSSLPAVHHYCTMKYMQVYEHSDLIKMDSDTANKSTAHLR